MASLGSTVVALLQKEFGIGDASDASPKAHMLFKTIKELIEDAEDGFLEVVKQESLELDEELVDPSWVLSEEEDNDEVVLKGDGYVFGERMVDAKTVTEAVSYFRSPGQGYRSLGKMSNRYRWIKSPKHLQKLRDIESNKESRQKTIERIKDQLAIWMTANLDAGHSLHDSNLRHQALKINREQFQLEGFTASGTFINNFKKKHRVCSRKVTKFVSRKNMVDKKKLDEAAIKFVEDVKKLARKERIPSSAIFNGDQSGFTKEQHGARSLAHSGQKTVIRVVGSVSATTHSYTVLPQVAANGTLRSKIFIVLQEQGGKLPTNHYQPDNLVVHAHNSHIMTKDLMLKWLKECVFTPDLPKKSLLILDSWPPFRDHAEIQKHVPPGKKVFIVNIPAGCTGKIQPLDIYFFIHVKKFMKYMTSHVQLQGVAFPIHQRDNILKAVSQIFWLFDHPRFAGFLKYSWSSAGYIPRCTTPFTTPAQYAFSSMNKPDCEKNGCDQVTFLRCSHCEKCFCFNCFVVLVHRC